jgi:hypothetical protein
MLSLIMLDMGNGGNRMNAKVAQGKVTLEVLNPRGVLQSVPIMGLINPRIKDLDGKRLAIMSEKPMRLSSLMRLQNC